MTAPPSDLDVRRQLVDLADRIARERFAPRVAQWDEDRTPLPIEERLGLGELGFLGMTLPSEYGGADRSLLDAVEILEAFAKHSQVAAFPVFEAAFGAARVIQLHGTDAQRERFLPEITSGRGMMAVAISEPDAGSAATDLATTAVLDGDAYVVNGVKRWCSGAGHAEFYLTYVRFERTKGASAIGALIIDKDTPGVSFGPQERLMGFRGIPSADMYFDNVRVPADRLVVGPGGFRKLFGAFSIERLGNAAMSLAIGQAALDRASQYVQEREQFGKQLIDFQMVQATLAEMVIQVEAARLLIQRAARNAGHGAPTALEVSVAKAFSNRMAEQVSEMALKLHGGYGYSIEFGLERLHRDALGWGIAGGTYDMQRLRIVSEYLGRRFDQRR